MAGRECGRYAEQSCRSRCPPLYLSTPCRTWLAQRYHLRPDRPRVRSGKHNCCRIEGRRNGVHRRQMLRYSVPRCPPLARCTGREVIVPSLLDKKPMMSGHEHRLATAITITPLIVSTIPLLPRQQLCQFSRRLLRVLLFVSDARSAVEAEKRPARPYRQVNHHHTRRAFIGQSTVRALQPQAGLRQPSRSSRT